MSEQSPNYVTQPNKGINLKSLEIVWHDSLEEFMRAKWAGEIAAMAGGYDEWLQDHGYSSTEDAAGYICGTGVGVFFDGNKLQGWLDIDISSEVAVYFLAHYISAHIPSLTLDNIRLLFAEVALHAHRLALTHKQTKEVADGTHHLPQKKQAHSMGNEANPLPGAIALSMALAEIDTELWEQNDTIDRAAKTIVEQWGLMVDLANALGSAVELLQQQGWTGASLEQSKVALDKAREALS